MIQGPTFLWSVNPKSTAFSFFYFAVCLLFGGCQEVRDSVYAYTFIYLVVRYILIVIASTRKLPSQPLIQKFFNF